ncbi:MAG: laminin G, partial [Ignavibacteriales bacterium]|nr:laminin G [Ignavibacteriales bacterium]
MISHQAEQMVRDVAMMAWVICVVPTVLGAQQLLIPRIEQMPNLPTPYTMRDWKRVALSYDSLAFDLTKAGTYFPLAWTNSNTINYPAHSSVGIHSYVGTNASNASEAINVLPAVTSAALVGIDKRNQNGSNWALMCEEYFNKRPSENVYLNRPVAKSGNDWWYETMPNVFFYQLYHFYPDVGDFKNQFTSIADRWLQAVKAMNGSATPWRQANMNYRAWSLSTMTPNSSGVPEPEAAGAVGWILYNAFVTTGDVKYRMGAEWAMEFLNNETTNPAYELQLPYGAYTAARMNAELGTTYDVYKLVNWCFEVGPLRQWGAIVGKWGGYDCSGLIGEVNGSNDYAFVMNTFEHIGALVPLVRYDDRFARAIGKWVLNAANASRLFYSGYLPDQNQDNRVWTQQYDPQSSIAYEALRQINSGKSPYGTGDAMGGGWAQTNLGLYGSSHVGILGSIIDTTNVEGILKLDLLATDYAHATAYPTFLFYNPYGVEKSVELKVGDGYHDIYDVVSKSFLMTNITGKTSLPIPAGGVVLIVITPTGGAMTYNLDKMLVNGVVVDYHSSRVVQNYPPRLKGLASAPTKILPGKLTTLYATAIDRGHDPLTYFWSGTQGTIAGAGQEVTWIAPNSTGSYSISCLVTDGRGG